MALKLGEMLMQEGLVTPEQLEEALRYQVIYGGKIGTNLIEMGLAEEGDIALTLSRKLRVPYVDPEQLMNIPEGVLRVVPLDIVEKYKVIPLRLDQKKLSLVMADPGNLPAIDEISFRTGYIIRPLVTPEVRLILALEKYYNIQRELRYILALGKIAPKKKGASSPDKPAARPPSAQEQALREALASADLSEIDEVLDLGEAELIEELPDVEVIDRFTPDAVSHQLADAKDRDEIAEALVGSLSRDFPRCALFLVKGTAATGWKGRWRGKAVEAFDRLQVSLEDPSVLKLVAESRSCYLGPLPDNPANAQILKETGGGKPQTVLFVPMIMLGRVVAILFVEGAPDLGERLVELQKLTAKAAMAFDILILRSKIIMT